MLKPISEYKYKLKDFLERNPRQVNWEFLSMNPNIFVNKY